MSSAIPSEVERAILLVKSKKATVPGDILLEIMTILNKNAIQLPNQLSYFIYTTGFVSFG